MKKLFLLFLFILCNQIIPQENSTFFSSPRFGLYAGISTESFNNLQGIYYFEGTTHLYDNLFLQFSVGFSKIYSLNSYNVKTNEYFDINNVEWYNAISYNVIKTEYKTIPISVGLQYEFPLERFKPYIDIITSYKWIDPSTVKSQATVKGYYSSYDQLPGEYKFKDVLPNSSWSLNIGIGSRYNISSLLDLDLRYLFQIENKLSNTHQITVGIIF